jgi:hypothetical protein
VSAALKTVRDLPPARADVSRHLGLAVYVAGPLGPAGLGLQPLWQQLSGTPFGPRMARCRIAADSGWRPIDEALALAGRLGREAPAAAAFQGAAFASKEGDPAFRLEVADRGDVLGMRRASQLLFRFPDDTTADTLAATAAWVLDHVPLWWGTAGWFFRVGEGPPSLVGRRLAGLAKRCWGVQLLDETALQWDALDGMPGVNWMNLVGAGFAEQAGAGLGPLSAQAAALRRHGVFHRAGRHGAAFAAGPQPLLGDINADERMDALVQVAELLQPLLLGRLSPLAGPFAKPEVLAAWLHRFSQPQAWLECDIGAD